MGENKNSGNNKKNTGIKIKILIIFEIILIVASVGIICVTNIGFDNVSSSLRALLSDFGIIRLDDIDVENAEYEIKLYVEQSNVLEPSEITAANLKSADGSYASDGGATTMYDGNTTTCSGSANEWATLDAGELKALSYIRYLPNINSQEMANTCVGTKFLASKDNVEFVELATVYPDVNGDLTMDWHTVQFSGYGEYRYFKVALSSYASFSEIEWVCADGIKLDKDGKSSFDVTAFDAADDFYGLTTLVVYNRDRIIKDMQIYNCGFNVGGYESISFSNLSLDVGDYVEITAYNASTMKPAAASVLKYRYTDASPELYMSNTYSDNMMFQADTDCIISGNAVLGAEVYAELKNIDTGEVKSAGTVVQDTSDWSINLGTYENGGNYVLTVKSEGSTLEYENITFGDIWIFAGQSNMDFYLCGETEGEELLKSSLGKKQATNSGIRIVNLHDIGISGATGEVDNVPLNDWNEYWTELTPDRASYLSAIAYYFAVELNERYGRNVGIISVAVGDTEINQWFPRGETNGTFTGDSGKLYNNRIYPFTKRAVKGILWYQGEADQYRTNMTAQEYSDAMSGLINTYRDKWNEPDLPFYYVQLARYSVKDESEIREGQRLALQKVRSNQNLGLISLIDIIGSYEQGVGCARTDIHPWQKKLVAERYLNVVARDLYGDTDTAVTGPSYSFKEIVGNKIILTFKHTGSLKIMDKSSYADSVCDENIVSGGIDTNVLHEFQVSDASGVFYPANAEIVDDKVVVWSDYVDTPTDVVYAWGAYPEMPNLTDDSGLPALTFNTANGSEFE